MATEIDIAVSTTTYDVTITAEPNEYVVNINNEASGVQSVTGDLVDNTDPANPIIETPSIAQVLNVQDRVFKELTDTEYTFAVDDRVKFIGWAKGNNITLNLDDSGSIFPDYSTIIMSVGDDSTINAIGDTDLRLDSDNVNPLSTYNLLAGDFVVLKKANGVTWILTVLRRGSNGVPYTGATQDVDLGEFGLLTGNIEFDTTPTNIPTNAGSMVWNDSDGTVDLKLKGGNVTLQIGQESVLRVVNKTATNINLLESNYQAVRVTGAQGQRLKVDLAQATTDALSAETIGLVTETINNNQEGFITTGGLVRNIDTTGSLQSETWADGDILYLSATTAGQITKVKPSAPNHLIVIGYVVSAHATQGSIFVKVDNGYELDELHNVKIATPTNNQALTYTSATDLWENKTIIQDSISDGVTTVAPSQNAVFDALALKANISALSGYTRNIIKDAVASSAVTGTTTETILKSYEIPANTFAANDILHLVSARFQKTGTSGNTSSFRMYVNTSNSLSGAVQVGQLVGQGFYYKMGDKTYRFSGGNLTGMSFTGNGVAAVGIDSGNIAVVFSSTALNPANAFWIIFTGQNAVGTDSILCNEVLIRT